MGRKKSPDIMEAEARTEDAYNLAYQRASDVAKEAPYRMSGKITETQRKTIAKTDPAYKAARDAYLAVLTREERRDENSGMSKENEINEVLGSRLLPGYNETALHNVQIARDGLQYILSELEQITTAITGTNESGEENPAVAEEDMNFLEKKRAQAALLSRDGMGGDRRKQGATRMSSFWHRIQEHATELSIKLVQYRHILGMAEVTGSPTEARRLRPDIRLADDLKDCLFNVYNRAQRKLKSMDS